MSNLNNLPTQAEMFQHTRTHVQAARRQLGDARDWLRSDWVPENNPPPVAAAARATAADRIAKAKALLDEATAALDDALQHYRS